MIDSGSMLQRTVDLVRSDTWRMECLRAAASLDLPDWYLAAGFLRNAIWDVLHGRRSMTPLNDVDLVYFDPTDLRPATEAELEAALAATLPDAGWEVRNQARMHVRNGHPPYRDSQHAIAHWPEIPTCVGIRSQSGGGFVVAAPFGLEENWSLRVRPNRVEPFSPAVFNERVRRKRWLETWRRLQVEWAEEAYGDHS